MSFANVEITKVLNYKYVPFTCAKLAATNRHQSTRTCATVPKLPPLRPADSQLDPARLQTFGRRGGLLFSSYGVDTSTTIYITSRFKIQISLIRACSSILNVSLNVRAFNGPISYFVFTAAV